MIYVRVILVAAAFCALVFSNQLVAAQQSSAVLTQDPSSDALRLMALLETGGAVTLAEGIGQALGSADARAALAPHLVPVERRKPTVRAIAFDRDYGGVIRNIIVYQHGLSAEHPFTYFRFVYKRTGSGWALTFFNFSAEGPMPFPNGYGVN